MNFIKCFNFRQNIDYQHNLLFLITTKRNRSGYTIYNTVKAREEALEKIKGAQEFGKRKLLTHQKLAASLPISLKYLNDENVIDIPVEHSNNNAAPISEEHVRVQFPFESVYKLSNKTIDNSDTTKSVLELMQLRNELTKDKKSWMLNYDNFDDASVEIQVEERSDENINYGTPDPSCRISNTPCGGCGALLHCKDPSLPGYIPSEIFKNSRRLGGAELTAIICQRCYFLKHHNIALEVQVSDNDYPEVLKTISTKKGVVVLMVDLTDFPCSIWPGIADIFQKMPILVVGNKVDLLPRDSSKYLDQVRKKLRDYIKAYGFSGRFLVDVKLISATTGYGIEDLITTLQSFWRYKGDAYLVGCTNVGKSSLFNALLQSDYCKSKAEDLIQRATTSIWPGTTLNLLKFPISKPSGYKIELRKQRINQLKRLEHHQSKENNKLLRQTNDWRYSVLMGRIDRSSSKNTEKETTDVFSIRSSNSSTGIEQLGIDEDDPLYAHGRWCYDTPGVVQPDQILNLLTADELFLTLPKTLITPRTYCIRPGDSLFIAGLARLDFLEGRDSIWYTVFASEELPISICPTENADEYYQQNLGTKFLRVPCGDPQRLKKWPGLSEAKTFSVEAVDFDYSSKDVVLSNAGWISITGRRGRTMKLKAWTPERRGVYIRECLLPQAVNFKGTRISSTPSYKKHRYYADEQLWY